MSFVCAPGLFRSPCFELGAVGGRSQLVRLLDKSMSTLDSQHNTLAETTSARFGQLQRQFDMGGTVDDLRGRIEASEERTTGAVEAAAARTAAAERKIEAVESTLRDSSSTWDGGIAKATAVETALERYRKRNEERMTAMGNAQQLAAKEAQTLRAHLTEKTIELRKDLEARIKAEEMDRTRAFLLRAVC